MRRKKRTKKLKIHRIWEPSSLWLPRRVSQLLSRFVCLPKPLPVTSAHSYVFLLHRLVSLRTDGQGRLASSHSTILDSSITMLLTHHIIRADQPCLTAFADLRDRPQTFVWQSRLADVQLTRSVCLDLTTFTVEVAIEPTLFCLLFHWLCLAVFPSLAVCVWWLTYEKKRSVISPCIIQIHHHHPTLLC